MPSGDYAVTDKYDRPGLAKFRTDTKKLYGAAMDIANYRD